MYRVRSASPASPHLLPCNLLQRITQNSSVVEVQFGHGASVRGLEDVGGIVPAPHPHLKQDHVKAFAVWEQVSLEDVQGNESEEPEVAWVGPQLVRFVGFELVKNVPVRGVELESGWELSGTG